MDKEVKQVRYNGDIAVEEWLDAVNNAYPLFFPLWPTEFPKLAAVRLTADGDMTIPLTKRAMRQLIDVNCLWFCRVPVQELLAETSAEADWFH